MRPLCSHYNGAPNDVTPIVLVGKGITFDSGGISLKASAVRTMRTLYVCEVLNWSRDGRT